MTTAAPAPLSTRALPELEPAGLERRFYAFVLDRLLLWSLYAASAAGAYAWFLRDGRWLLGVAVVAGAVLLLSTVAAAVLGHWGVSAGKAALGLRVLDVEDGRPIGVARALLRSLAVGVGTLPTFGFGAAALAWTAASDPAGRRRGWHDLRSGSWVVDVRLPGEPAAEVVEEPPPLVNLTALRLVPPPPADWAVTFDTGEVVEVRGLVLVGRDPERHPGEPAGTLLALPSPHMSLSKTHAQLQAVPDGALVVMDRGSTNGSILVRGRLERRLEPGRPATLRPGDRVRFGDRQMTVSRLAPDLSALI